MRRASAQVTLPGVRIADAEALWYDVTRWPSFVEGFKHVERIDGAWPAAGSQITWQSVPDGRGRVTERVTSYVQREGQSLLDVLGPGLEAWVAAAIPEVEHPEAVADLLLGQLFAGFVRHIFQPDLDVTEIERAGGDAIAATVAARAAP